MKFDDFKISPDIKSQLDFLGFKRPTDIQFKAIGPILNGEDVLAVAQTGTGKTAAFVIPVLEKIDRNLQKHKRKGIQCLVMVPTRELALQITEVFQQIGKKLKIRTTCVIGGVEQDQQIHDLKNKVDILVATPGRMFDLIHQGYIQLDQVSTLVLDEADLMLDLGFYKDIDDIRKKFTKKRQTLFFSATITKKIKQLAYSLVSNAIRIQISPKNPVAKTIDHAVIFVEMDDKRFFLESTVKEYEDKKFVVFVRTKVRAERVMAAMERVQIKSEFLHGDVLQKDRFAILDRFKSGENRVLITTDVAARGIDIPDVDYVINYDLPENPENYVHRVGRTGRGGKLGQALAFCSKEEIPFLEEIETYTGDEIMRYELTRAEYEDILSDSDDGSYNWKKLLDEENDHWGTDESW